MPQYKNNVLSDVLSKKTDLYFGCKMTLRNKLSYTGSTDDYNLTSRQYKKILFNCDVQCLPGIITSTKEVSQQDPSKIYEQNDTDGPQTKEQVELELGLNIYRFYQTMLQWNRLRLHSK